MYRISGSLLLMREIERLIQAQGRGRHLDEHEEASLSAFWENGGSTKSCCSRWMRSEGSVQTPLRNLTAVKSWAKML